MDEVELADPLSQFNVDCEQLGLFSWPANSEDAGDTLNHDVELWLFVS